MISQSQNKKAKQKQTGNKKVGNRNVIIKFESVKLCINIDFTDPFKLEIAIDKIAQMYYA